MLLILGFRFTLILCIEGFDPHLSVIALLSRSLKRFLSSRTWVCMGATSLYFEGYRLSLSLSVQMPPKHTKQKAAPLVNRRRPKRQSTRRSATAVDHPSEAGVTRGQSAGGSQVGSQPEAPTGHIGSSQDVLPVLSSNIITQIVARVTQEVNSQLAQAHAPTIVPDPAQPASLCGQLTALAPIQPSSLAPTQQLSSLSSVQPQFSEFPVCSLENATVQSSVNNVFSHLTGELNPSSSPPSSLFTFSAYKLMCVSQRS